MSSAATDSDYIMGLAADAADRYNINRNAFQALLLTETQAGENNAAGYVGYGQLSHTNIVKYNVKNPANPEQNIDASAKIFSDLLANANGNLDAAVSTYKGLSLASSPERAQTLLDRYRSQLKYLNIKNPDNQSAGGGSTTSDYKIKNTAAESVKKGVGFFDYQRIAIIILIIILAWPTIIQLSKKR